MQRPLHTYGLTLAAVAAAALLHAMLVPLLGGRAPEAAFYLAVLAGSALGGWRAALLAALAGFGLWQLGPALPGLPSLPGGAQALAAAALYAAVCAAIALFGEALRAERRRVELQREALRSNLDSEQRKAESEAQQQALQLQQSEARLSAVLEQLPIGVGMADAQGRWVLHNRVFDRFVGDRLPARDTQAARRWQGWSPDGTPLEASQWPGERALRGETVTPGLDFLYSPDGGEAVWTRVSAAPFRDAGGEIVGAVSVVQDVDEAKRLERRLQDQVAEIDTLLRFIPVGVLRSQDRECSRIVGNPAAYRLFGMPPGSNLSATAPPGERGSFRMMQGGRDLAPQDMPMQRAALQGVEIRDMELDLHLDSGEVRHLFVNATPLRDATGRTRGSASATLDITMRKRAETALRMSEQRWRLIVESAREYAIFTVDMEGRVTGWNSGARNIFGYDEMEVSGRHARLFFTAEDRQLGRPEEELREALAQDRSEDERWHLRADGSRFWASGLLVPLRVGGEVVGFLKILRDMTRARQQKETLERQARALQEADRRKDEFLATLAHEIRNPLAPIRNALQLLKLSEGRPQVIEQARRVMERQVEQMVRLIDDLLDVSRISRGAIVLRHEDLDLADIVNAALETTRPLIDGPRHRLELDLPPEPVRVHADSTRLTQVLVNLLSNAAKYTPPGGRLRLTLRREGGQAELGVEDDGEGIPPALLTRIFEPFMQVDNEAERAHGGLGIGLTIVKRLVEMQGGSVAAHSEGPGRGSRFVVRLPVVESAPLPEAPPAPAELLCPAGRVPAAQRVLVVDDNVDNVQSIATLLELSGHDVRTAHDGQQGVALAESFRPDVVLLDIGMPVLNGYEACRRIRAQPWGRDMVLVAQTGWGTQADRQRTAEAGFDFHLVKPVNPGALLEMLNTLQARQPADA